MLYIKDTADSHSSQEKSSVPNPRVTNSAHSKPPPEVHKKGRHAIRPYMQVTSTSFPMPATSSPNPVPSCSQTSHSISSTAPPSLNPNTSCDNPELVEEKKEMLSSGSSASSQIVLNFPPNIDGSECMPSTGSDVRDRCRELLVKALKKGLDKSKMVTKYLMQVLTVYLHFLLQLALKRNINFTI